MLKISYLPMNPKLIGNTILGTMYAATLYFGGVTAHNLVHRHRPELLHQIHYHEERRDVNGDGIPDKIYRIPCQHKILIEYGAPDRREQPRVYPTRFPLHRRVTRDA
jgi:hypothetical protein